MKSLYDGANEIMRERHGEDLRSRQIKALADATETQLRRLEGRIKRLEADARMVTVDADAMKRTGLMDNNSH